MKKQTGLTLNVLTYLILLLSLQYASAMFTTTIRIRNTGTARLILTINAYSDFECTDLISSIDWGDVWIPSVTQQIFYLKNDNVTSSFNVAFLITNYSNPNFTAEFQPSMWIQPSTYNPVDSLDVLTVTLTLQAQSDATVGAFSFDFVVTATEI